MFVLVLVLEAVHILVAPEVGSAGPVDDEVRRRAPLQTLALVPQLQLAPIPHDQGLKGGGVITIWLANILKALVGAFNKEKALVGAL